METLPKNLRAAKDPEEALNIARKAVEAIKKIHVVKKGTCPSSVRWAGAGSYGELWFRNRLLWLRTLPLEPGISFIITHIEAPVYYKENDGLCRADLLGIWRSKNESKLCILELKAARRQGSDDNILYAMIEGARNAYLHNQREGRERLIFGWRSAKKMPAYFINAWGKGNPFKELQKDARVVIIGDFEWTKEQMGLYEMQVRSLASEIGSSLKITVSAYSLNKNAKSGSKSYMLLPIQKWPI